jgi:hypothetical protein
MDMSETQIPRPEYPRPQMARKEWLNLNGPWEFELDPKQTGEKRKLPGGGKFKQQIVVPFCPESSLSGLGHTGFMPCVFHAFACAQVHLDA